MLNVNLYGESTLKTKDLEVEQKTDYPWDGKVTLTVKKAKNLGAVRLHIPNWCDEYSLKVNGETYPTEGGTKGAAVVEKKFKKGDSIELNLNMRPRLIEANPLVEEAKNQVAVMRGPVVYCLEGQDIEGGHRINDIAIPDDIELKEVPMEIAGHRFIALEGEAQLIGDKAWDNNTLYREIGKMKDKAVKIRLIPYYAWDNRGVQDMTLWMNRNSIDN